MEYKKFDLEKIKETTSPIESIQAELNHVEEQYAKLVAKSNEIIEVLQERDLIVRIEELSNNINNINKNISSICTNNLNQFLYFQDLLITKYKDSFKDSLKFLDINLENTKKLGLSFIQRKLVFKVLEVPFYISSISLDHWIELLKSLKNNSLFSSIIKKMEKYFIIILKRNLDKEIALIGPDVDIELLDAYKKEYFNNPISFDRFLNEIQKKISKKDFKRKRKITEKLKDQEELNELKKKQEEQFHSSTYQDYIHLSDEEFERRRRKQKREKLSELSTKPIKDIEISQEVIEKIEKFKEQLSESFEEKYLVKKDEEKDPLEIIRERKKKKQKEYKDFIKKLKDEN